MYFPVCVTLLSGDGSSLPVVRAGDIEAVVAAWSGVPVEQLTEDEMSKLVRLVSAGQQVELEGGRQGVAALCCGGGGPPGGTVL